MSYIQVSEEWKDFLKKQEVQINEDGIIYYGDRSISLEDLSYTERIEIFAVAYDKWTPWKCDGLTYMDNETGELFGYKRLSGDTRVLMDKVLLYIVPANIIDTINPEEFYTEEEIEQFDRDIVSEDYIETMEQDEEKFKRRLFDLLDSRIIDN